MRLLGRVGVRLRGFFVILRVLAVEVEEDNLFLSFCFFFL
jgi:hypothetical protein